MTPCELVLHMTVNSHLYKPGSPELREAYRRQPELVEHVKVCNGCADRMIAYIHAASGHYNFLSTNN